MEINVPDRKTFHLYLDDEARALLKRLEPLAEHDRRSLGKMLVMAAERGAEQIEKEQAA